jgi:hypothetical protein
VSEHADEKPESLFGISVPDGPMRSWNVESRPLTREWLQELIDSAIKAEQAPQPLYSYYSAEAVLDIFKEQLTRKQRKMLSALPPHCMVRVTE